MTRKQSDNQNEAVPAPAPAPRERVLAAAGELFYNDGIRATGVDAIAARGNTTKMAIYRHFQSKDVLVTEWLRQVIDDYWRALDAIEAAHPGEPRAQILGWVTYFSDEARAWSHRGCAFINSIAELDVYKRQELTRMPDGPSSIAQVCVSPASPNLLAL